MTKKEFKVGDTIYVSHFRQRDVEIDCPVCFRKKIVTLTLGNGDFVELPCEYCKSGYEGPRGYVKENRVNANVESLVITEIQISLTDKGKEVDYCCGCHLYHQNDVFNNKKDALKESERKAIEHNLEQETKAELAKSKPDKSYSWNAGYHMREVKKAQKQVEYHTKMAKICRSKS